MVCGSPLVVGMRIDALRARAWVRHTVGDYWLSMYLGFIEGANVKDVVWTKKEDAQWP